MHSALSRIARARALAPPSAALTAARRPDVLPQSHRLIRHNSTSAPTQAVPGRAAGFGHRARCNDSRRGQIAVVPGDEASVGRRGVSWNGWSIGGRRGLHNQAAASEKETEEVGYCQSHVCVLHVPQEYRRQIYVHLPYLLRSSAAAICKLLLCPCRKYRSQGSDALQEKSVRCFATEYALHACCVSGSSLLTSVLE